MTMVDSLIFALKEIYQYLKIDNAIAGPMKNTKSLKEWMETLEFMSNKRYFVDHHRNLFLGLKLDEKVVMLGARDNEWYHFLDVSVTMQAMFYLRIGEVPLIP